MKKINGNEELRMKNLRRVLSFVICLCLVFSFGGCCEKADSTLGTDSTENAALTEITVVLDWTPNTNHSGLYAAKELGYYEEAGLKVNIVQPPEDGAEALVASGKAEFGISFQDTMAPAFDNDEPLDIAAVAAVVQHNLSGIISRGDKGIDSFKNMENATYATWGSPVEQAIIKYCMEKEGGDFGKLEMIDTYVTDVLTALDTDMVDCVWVYEYWDVIKAQIENYDYNYIDFKDVDVTMDYYTPVIISSNKYLSENGETAKKFLDATKKGYEYCSKNPAEAAEILLRADESLDRDLIVKSAEFMADKYVDEEGNWGYIDEARWNNFYSWLYSEGLVGRELVGKGYSLEYLG